MNRRARLVPLVALLALSPLLAACGSGDTSSSDGRTSGGQNCARPSGMPGGASGGGMGGGQGGCGGGPGGRTGQGQGQGQSAAQG